MSWSNDEHDNEGTLHKVPVSMLLRWFLYDIAGEDANDQRDIFNLSAVSEEGHEKEVDESLNRLVRIEDLLPLISFYASTTADYAYALHRKSFKEIADITEEMLDASEEPLKEFYTNMAFAALLTAFASTAELGIIKLTGAQTSVKKEKYE
jgi:hypothetical protein